MNFDTFVYILGTILFVLGLVYGYPYLQAIGFGAITGTAIGQLVDHD